jgi:type IV pilus assembly protein PilC
MLFSYTGRNPSGKKEKGELDAPNVKEAVVVLKTRGLIVTGLTPKHESPIHIPWFSGKVSLKEKIIFTRQLAVMIRAGLPISEALRALSEQTANKKMAKTTLAVATDVEGGTSFSQALGKHPDIFPPLYRNLIKTGEVSGKLEEVLFRLSDQQEKDYELTSRVRSAMIYPIVIFTALLLVVGIIVVFVMPQIQKIFTEFNAPLPIPTRILIGAAGFLQRFALFVFAGLVAFTFGLRFLIRRSSQVKAVIDTLALKFPIFGPLSVKVTMARFTNTVSTLIAAGLPMLQVLETTVDLMGNMHFADAMRRVKKEVENGVALSQALRREKIIPVIVAQVAAIGEKSGNIDDAFKNLGDFYDREVDATTKNLTALLEPLLLIVIGIGVGFVVTSVILPIYNLVNVT